MRFWSLQGEIEYGIARELQLQLVELRSLERIPDTVLFLEHKPVITRGKGLQFTGQSRPRSMPLSVPLPEGIAFSESERGGDLTYHGPGQLVVYPIIKLNSPRRQSERQDIASFIRWLEQILIDPINEWELGERASRRSGATGVWIGELKVASIGIALRKWVSYHGIAVNCVNDLSPFRLISPCGFSPEVMTRLVDHLPETEKLTWGKNGWRRSLENRLMKEMELAGDGAEVPPRLEELSVEEAFTACSHCPSRSKDEEALSELLNPS